MLALQQQVQFPREMSRDHDWRCGADHHPIFGRVAVAMGKLPAGEVNQPMFLEKAAASKRAARDNRRLDYGRRMHHQTHLIVAPRRIARRLECNKTMTQQLRQRAAQNLIFVSAPIAPTSWSMGMSAFANDEEFGAWLGFTPEESARVMPKFSAEKRALFEKMRQLEIDANLWAAGLGPKPTYALIDTERDFRKRRVGP